MPAPGFRDQASPRSAEMLAFLGKTAQFLRKRRFLAIWAAGIASTIFVLVAAFAPYSPLDRLNALVFDVYQNFKPRQPTESPVLVVDIDDGSIAALGQWPWPRTVLADDGRPSGGNGTRRRSVSTSCSRSPTAPRRRWPSRNCAASASRFPTPPKRRDLDHDRLLAASFARAPVVTRTGAGRDDQNAAAAAQGGLLLRRRRPQDLSGRPTRAACATSGRWTRRRPVSASSAFLRAGTASCAQIPLVSRYEGNLYPALALELLRVAQGASTLLIRSTGARGELDTGDPGMVAVKNGDYEVPTGPDGIALDLLYGRAASGRSCRSRACCRRERRSRARRLVAGRIVLSARRRSVCAISSRHRSRRACPAFSCTPRSSTRSSRARFSAARTGRWAPRSPSRRCFR